jgi:hypothetical protein
MRKSPPMCGLQTGNIDGEHEHRLAQHAAVPTSRKQPHPVRLAPQVPQPPRQSAFDLRHAVLTVRIYHSVWDFRDLMSWYDLEMNHAFSLWDVRH